MTASTKLVIALLCVPVLFLINVFWGAFVSSTLWGWFLVPLGVPAITYWHAVGIGSVIAAFLGSRGMPPDIEDKDEDMKFWRTMGRGFGHQIFIPAMCLLFGWVAHINAGL